MLRGYRGPRVQQTRIDIQPGVHLAVFWKDVPHGSGPGVALIVADEEILLFDCFGKPGGHFHIHPERDLTRFEFIESTTDDQIDHAAFEIEVNAIAYIRGSLNPMVRRKAIDRDALANAARQARELMRRLRPPRGLTPEA